MSYSVASGLLASNYLRAVQRVLPGGLGENRATSKTCEITWLSDRLSRETRHGKSTFRLA
jgi:hypothetical protein